MFLHGLGRSQSIAAYFTRRRRLNSTTNMPCLTLMPNCEDQDGVLVSLKAIQRDITSLAARDDQFPQIRLDWSTYQWMTP